MQLQPSDFLNLAKELPILDVRTPAEFAQGHIPGAHNLPLFTNGERAVVGTIYKKVGKEEAVLEGLKIVGPKMASFVVEAKSLAYQKQVLVHCWRGGMRSGSMAWLLNTAGLTAHTLVGGYKAYRAYIRGTFLRPQKIYILGGMTGSNKTYVLKEMHKLGAQFIDIEEIAQHRGSSYGQIGMKAQPTNEQFENDVAAQWLQQSQDEVLWLEDESKAIGAVRIVDELFQRMRTAPLFILHKSKELRIRHLLDEYANLDKELLRQALLRIEKRIGGNNLNPALEALEHDDFKTVADISLFYYDKTYQYGIQSRADVPKVNIETELYNPAALAQLVLEMAQKSNF
jgi:tRNA 2-selenouridine synthase